MKNKDWQKLVEKENQKINLNTISVFQNLNRKITQVNTYTYNNKNYTQIVEMENTKPLTQPTKNQIIFYSDYYDDFYKTLSYVRRTHQKEYSQSFYSDDLKIEISKKIQNGKSIIEIKQYRFNKSGMFIPEKYEMTKNGKQLNYEKNITFLNGRTKMKKILNELKLNN